MSMAAMWFQDSDMSAVANSTHWIMIFTGLIALALLIAAIAMMLLAVKLMAAIKDVLATFDSVKGKLLPVIQSGSEALESVKMVVRDTTPKIKTVTDNLVDASYVVRGTAHELQGTVSDANQRTARQVARVDSMITATLTATAELASTVNHGIRVPAEKVAVMATQTKLMFEGLFDKAKSMGMRYKPW